MNVGYVYDPIYLEHNTGQHVENAGRLEAIISHLEETLADRRAFYNDSVNNYNIRIKQIPDVLVAGMLNYQDEEMFIDIPEDPSAVRAFPSPRTIDRFICTFAKAIADFAAAYADQTERDYQTLVQRVKSGQIAAEIE